MKKYIYNSILVFIVITTLGFVSATVSAQVNAGPQQPPLSGVNGGPQQPPATTGATVGKIQNPIKVNSLSDFVATVLEVILKIAILIIAAFIIYSGLMFVLARGNSEKLEQAKTRLLYTLIGAGVILGAWMIATVVKTTIEALTA